MGKEYNFFEDEELEFNSLISFLKSSESDIKDLTATINDKEEKINIDDTFKFSPNNQQGIQIYKIIKSHNNKGWKLEDIIDGESSPSPSPLLRKKRSGSRSPSPPAKKAKTSFFSIVVKDGDDVIKQINKQYVKELKDGKKIKTGTKFIKTTEYPNPDDTYQDAQGSPILQDDDIYVKVENNKVVDYNYHDNFSERSYSYDLPDGQPSSFDEINKYNGWGGGRKTYKKKSRKTYKKKSKKTYKKKGKKTYKKKSRNHNKKRKTRKL